MRFYADENFPKRTVEELRNLGHDVLTAYEDKKANLAISDEDVLSRAAELSRSVLTLNRLDFKRLHKKNPVHSGIVICTEDFDRKRQAERINIEISKFEKLDGELMRVYRPDKLI